MDSGVMTIQNRVNLPITLRMNTGPHGADTAEIRLPIGTAELWNQVVSLLHGALLSAGRVARFLADATPA
jgi:hypothetical protein